MIVDTHLHIVDQDALSYPWLADAGPLNRNSSYEEYAREARRLGIQETMPRKAPKPARPLKRGAAFVAVDGAGAVLLVKRPDSGLLASMLEPPLGPWGEDFPSKDQAVRQAPFAGAWKKRAGVVRHGFTHFDLTLQLRVLTGGPGEPAGAGEWWPIARLEEAGLPTLFAKAARLGVAG